MVLFLCAHPAVLRADFRQFEALPVDVELQAGIERVATTLLETYPEGKLVRGNLSITLVNLTDPAAPRRASFDGRVGYHPASVVKMFYLVNVHDLVARKALAMDSELERALRDMIVESLNDATSYVVDRISGTTSGPELEGRAWRQWLHRRNAMNRYFAGLGYDINVVGKTWCEGVYGRESQLVGPERKNRNRVTSDAAASLLLSIVRGTAVSPAHSRTMLALLSRRLHPPRPDENQVQEFVGAALPPGAQLWSKAGWTSEVRHDAAYVELPGGEKFVVAIFTRGVAGDLQLLPRLAASVVELVRRPVRVAVALPK